MLYKKGAIAGIGKRYYYIEFNEYLNTKYGWTTITDIFIV